MPKALLLPYLLLALNSAPPATQTPALQSPVTVAPEVAQPEIASIAIEFIRDGDTAFTAEENTTLDGKGRKAADNCEGSKKDSGYAYLVCIEHQLVGMQRSGNLGKDVYPIIVLSMGGM